jgi:hypothetical protein
MKQHPLCATNRVPIPYEPTTANVADVSLTGEPVAEAALGNGAAKRVSGELAYRSEESKQALAETGILPVTEPSERRQVEIAISGLSRASSLGEPLATTLAGLATRISTEIAAYTTASLRQPGGGPSPRPLQGAVGMKTLQHSSCRGFLGIPFAGSCIAWAPQTLAYWT